MAISSDRLINNKILEMRNGGARINTIHKWLICWDNFSQLDEIVCLSHILNILNKNNLAVSRNEVRTCFNKNYNKEFHGDKQSYLNWIYKNFSIKKGTLVETSQARDVVFEKRAVTQTTGGKSGSLTHDLNKMGNNTTKHPIPQQNTLKVQYNEVSGVVFDSIRKDHIPCKETITAEAFASTISGNPSAGFKNTKIKIGSFI